MRSRGLRRVCKRLHPEQDHADVDHGKIVLAALFIPGGDAPGLFEAVDQPLHLVAQPVGLAVEVALAWLVLPGRDHRSDVASSQARACGRTAVPFATSRGAGAQTGAAASRMSDRPLIEHRFKGDLLIALTSGQHHGDRPSMALGAQVQLGREPALAAPKSFPRLSLLRGGSVAASTASVLVSTDNGGIHEVEVPIDLATLLRASLQSRQNAPPDPSLAPAVEPARHRAHWAVTAPQNTPPGPRAIDPQNAVQNLPVVLIRPPCPWLLRRQQRLQPLPLLVRQFSSSHGTDIGRQTRNISRLQTRPNPSYSVRPDGAYHQWGKDPPRELSIDLVADERLGRVTGQVEAS